MKHNSNKDLIFINNSINNFKEIQEVSVNENNKSIDYSRNSFFNAQSVKKAYSQGQKIRLQTLISDRGLTEPKFYKKLGISRNYWYLISYGKISCPLELKIKIARELKTDSALIFQEQNNEVCLK